MKAQIIFFAFLAGPSLVFAAPCRHKSFEKREPATASSPIMIRPAPYPDSPYTNEFQYINFDEGKDGDKKARATIHNAFRDVPAMMQKALESIENSFDKTFDRWFPEDFDLPGQDKPINARDHVGDVFRQLLQADTKFPTAKDTIKNAVVDRKDFWLDGNGKGYCTKGRGAYMSRSEPHFHICPTGLKWPTAASNIKCADLGDKVSLHMHSLTGLLLHEFMHLQAAGEFAPNSTGHINDWVYAPGNCYRLRNGGNREDQQKTFTNADSYTWLAANAYYNSVCGKEFGLPNVLSDITFTRKQDAEAEMEDDAAVAFDTLA